MGKNLLRKTKCYLIGPMESEIDCGAGWRNKIQKSLKDLNINWLDPVNKKFVDEVQESGSMQKQLKQWREEGNYDKVTEHMKLIRRLDLSCIDRSDFVICYYDSEKHTCGTWEELFNAVKIKRAIFLIAKNGIKTIPLWLFACLPYKYFYNSVEDCIEMIRILDSGKKKMNSDRWRLLKPEYR